MLEKNYRVYYYASKDLVFSHLLRYDHICFILEKEFHTSPSQMGCYFTLTREQCGRFCWFMTRFTSDKNKSNKKKKSYLTTNFVNWFSKDCSASIDVVRFADLDDDVCMTKMTYV